MVTAGILWGRGGPKSGSAPSHPRHSSPLALPLPLLMPTEEGGTASQGRASTQQTHQGALALPVRPRQVARQPRQWLDPAPRSPRRPIWLSGQRGRWMCQRGDTWQRPGKRGPRQKGGHLKRLRNTGRKARWLRPRPGSSQGKAGGSRAGPCLPGEGLALILRAAEKGFKQVRCLLCGDRWE